MSQAFNQVALVTGASRGLGAAIVHRLLTDGYYVVLMARQPESLAAFASTLNPARVFPLACDVTDPLAVARALGGVEARWGQLDALVNAAGVSARATIDAPDAGAVWSHVLDVNLHGTFHVTRQALPLLADGGRIVNLSSDLGKSGLAGYSAYCAAKHGVIGLTRALALELAHRRITVNAVCPGWVETDMAERGFQEIADAIGTTPDAVRQAERDAVPLGRFATPDEVAALVAYLLSDGAAIMTGQALNLCGGTITS